MVIKCVTVAECFVCLCKNRVSVLKFLMCHSRIYKRCRFVFCHSIPSTIFLIDNFSVGALQGIWKNDLVALKGVCPNCGEEVSLNNKLHPFTLFSHSVVDMDL